MTLNNSGQENPEPKGAARPANEQSAQPQTPLPPAPAGFQPLPAPPHRNTAQEEAGEPEEWRKNATLGLEIAGLVVLSVYTCFAGCQWKVANDTLTEIRNSKADTNRIITASETQADAATKVAGASDRSAAAAANFALSADGINTKTKLAVDKFDRLAKSSENSIAQAKQTLDATIKLSRLETRAWVAVGKQTLKGLTLIVEITNSGKTPAFDVVMGSRAQHWCCDLQVEHGSVRVEAEKKSKGILVPGASVWLVNDMSPSFNPPTTITPPEVYNPTAHPSDWKEKTVHQVIGTVEYKDVFGAAHWTNFCVRTQGFPDLNNVVFCDGGNDTDDNPEKPKK